MGDELVPEPTAGRCFRAERRVRLGDADPSRRLRLDALARLLQDVGNDDLTDAGLDPWAPWVARRTVVEAAAWPRLGERLSLSTWCGGLGSRWAERRTSVRSEGGGALEVASLWIFVGTSGRPDPLPDWFLEVYGEAAGGRRVSSRLAHPTPGSQVVERPWPLRATDLDVLGHVNNAATWAAVEDELSQVRMVPARAELEYRDALDAGDEPVLASSAGDDGLRCWLTVGGVVRASALVLPAPAA